MKERERDREREREGEIEREREIERKREREIASLASPASPVNSLCIGVVVSRQPHTHIAKLVGNQSAGKGVNEARRPQGGAR